jgi:hypothetical protein
MKHSIGVMGSAGDLGSQLVSRLKEYGFLVLVNDPQDEASVNLNELASRCSIIHICAPLEAVAQIPETDAILVLHDSVMATSQKANVAFLNNKGVVIHMLMNKHNTAILAGEGAAQDIVQSHLGAIGLTVRRMTIKDHDYMVARSQAPLALLIKVLLPYLYTQADKGLLTPSGQLLADTLHSRDLIWTDSTVHSILQNPELPELINEMQSVIATYQGNHHETFFRNPNELK